MHRKRVSLVINPREGQNIAKITDILAVLAAAGWDTRLLLKKYYGETVSLGMKAVQEGADLVVSYGGDGTLNQVVNGVLKAKGKSIVGLIPGGTANEWAGEMHIPADPVKAALALKGGAQALASRWPAEASALAASLAQPTPRERRTRPTPSAWPTCTRPS